MTGTAAVDSEGAKGNKGKAAVPSVNKEDIGGLKRGKNRVCMEGLKDV